MRALIAIALVIALPAAAQEASGNLPADFYPAPDCTKPDKSRLGTAPGPGNESAMVEYYLKVKAFNDQATAFNACMKAYTDSAQADIATIQRVVHAAVSRANAP